tara:strand:- start:1280 stop:1558 length:279 start_codon:yes stop_codon:yes gene_type:complete
MIIEEIHSFFVNDERETIEVEFTVGEDDIETTLTLEILFEEIESLCDLFVEVEWCGYDDDDVDTLQIRKQINPDELKEGLHTYINQNKNLLK